MKRRASVRQRTAGLLISSMFFYLENRPAVRLKILGTPRYVLSTGLRQETSQIHPPLGVVMAG